MTTDEVYIVSACRTPIGTLCGGLSSIPAHELGAIVIKEALNRGNIKPDEVSEVVMGQTLIAGQGQNPAKQAASLAGLPTDVTAYGINMLCGSGLKSVLSGYYKIKCGDASIVVCGGQESMSLAPHVMHLRLPTKLGPATLKDTVITDGLTDAFHKVHMGETAEEIAKRYNITREDQDQLAYRSQMRTKEAQRNKLFEKEIVPITVTERNKTNVVSVDEFPKPDTTLDSLKKLKPAFVKVNGGLLGKVYLADEKLKECLLFKDGTVTPGNASGINDGAAAVVLCSKQVCMEKNLKPMARIVAVAETGCEPIVMGLGPIKAVNLVLKKANWEKKDVDIVELNEAFAAQALGCIRELGISEEKININGGAIALGHPIGASGTRVLVTLLYALESRSKKRGVASLCIGGGMGIAIAVEKC